MNTQVTKVHAMGPLAFPYRVFSVDPATGDSGWAVIDVRSLAPLAITIVAHGKLNGDKLLKTKKELAAVFQRRFCILDALEEEYTRLITKYNPAVIVSESAYSHIHINAMESLTLVIHVLRRVSRAILGKDILLVPPTISKLAFTGSGGADKDKMRRFYHSNVFLSGKGADSDISEHEVDAIAHGCGHIRRDLVGDIVQLSAKEKKQRKRERQQRRVEQAKAAG